MLNIKDSRLVLFICMHMLCFVSIPTSLQNCKMLSYFKVSIDHSIHARELYLVSVDKKKTIGQILVMLLLVAHGVKLK